MPRTTTHHHNKKNGLKEGSITTAVVWIPFSNKSRITLSCLVLCAFLGSSNYFLMQVYRLGLVVKDLEKRLKILEDDALLLKTRRSGIDDSTITDDLEEKRQKVLQKDDDASSSARKNNKNNNYYKYNNNEIAPAYHDPSKADPSVNYNYSLGIHWLHIQKTGTSLFTTIYLHFCPKVLKAFPGIVTTTQAGKKVVKLADLQLLSKAPPSIYCPEANIINMPCPGCHHSYRPRKYRDGTLYPPGRKTALWDEESVTTFAMFREPKQRLASAFAFDRAGSKIPRNITNVTLQQYIQEPQIPNCQIKMLLGDPCFHFVDQEELRTNMPRAYEIISSPQFYFGVTDRWDESICLFHAWYDRRSDDDGTTSRRITVPDYEVHNIRPTRNKAQILAKAENSPEVILNDYFDLDVPLFEYASQLFDKRLKDANCLGYKATATAEAPAPAVTRGSRVLR